ncbi:DUF368 domain-containing protein [Nocardiopsis sp. CNT-189]|uniref:DUF368 domain-containing protein n=1 Tax=Nocardiopsis oceanisediminis TaxID=2816862 RepID=UPI003B3568BE
MAKSIGTHLFNVVRGGLIGTAEVVPGVSGGTVALIVGVYETLITSAGHVLSGLRAAVSDLPRGRGAGRAAAEFRQADWAAIGAVLVGMVAAALLAAKIIAPLVESEQQRSYALFFGLVLASLWVPYTAAGQRWKAWHYLLAAAVGAVAFVVTGLPPAHVEPSAPAVIAAAAVAVSALIMPGMSGSFILLTLGLYTPTMDALNNRDFGYIGTFVLGAFIGGALFVKLLQWLLEHHRMVTLVALTGVMAGSLRALWPWQDEERTLYAPSGDVPFTLAMVAVGFAVVVAVLLIEHLVKGGGRKSGSGGGRHARPAVRESARL